MGIINTVSLYAMQIKKYLVILISLCGLGESYPQDFKIPYSDLKHPPFSLEKHAISDDGKSYVFFGAASGISKKKWESWGDNIKTLPYFETVNRITITNCTIDANVILYISMFPNLEHVELGLSPEGISLPPESLSHLKKIKKLRSLSCSIHGLTDSYLEKILELPLLEELLIEFPTKNMLPQHERKFWKETKVTKEAILEIGKMKSLKSLRIFGKPHCEGEQFLFDIRVLQNFLKRKDLEEMILCASLFTPEESKEIKNLALPEFVKILRQ